MRKVTDFIVEKRYFILITFIVLTVVCIFLIPKVNINHEISEYLPSDSETRLGMNKMEKEFGDYPSSYYNIMFKGLSDKERKNIYEELTKIDNVKSVEYDDSKEYNNGEYTYYIINVDDSADSKTSSQVFKDIQKKYEKYNTKTSGDIASHNKPVLHAWIVALAISFAMIILIIMCDSYIHPFLILFSVGLAVFINKGTNIMFPSVSHITDSIVAVLQMALSMDYAIMLINRFNQEKEKTDNKVEAMKEALSKSFSSIASSSVTTIVGLLALVFMSFTIGRDLGFVLAKGVLLSLLSILFCLPCLLLIFDNLIEKTHKKVFNPKLIKLGIFEFLIRHISIPLMIVLFIASFFLKGNLGILYTDTEMNEVAKEFTLTNQMAIIYKNSDEEKIAQYCKNLEGKEHVKQVLCYGNTINEKLKYNELLNKLSDLGTEVDIDDYLIKIIYYNYYNKNNDSKMTFEQFIRFINSEVYSNEKISKKISEENKNNLNKLKYFSYKDEYNKKRASSDIANILGIDKEKVDLLLIYYNSKNQNNKLTISEFINFVTKDVLTNPKYSNEISKKNKEDLNTLKKFTNKNLINKKLSSKEMSNLFNIDSSMVDSLYTYYLINNSVDTKLSIGEFIDFILKDVITNKDYSSSFDNTTINSLKSLKPFTNKNFVTKNMNFKELSNVFGLNEESTNGILFLYYSSKSNTSKYSLKELLYYINYLKTNTNYLDSYDLSGITKLKPFIENTDNFNTKKMTKNELKYVFNSINPNLVDQVYGALSLPESAKFSPQEFINIVIDNMSSHLDNNSLKQLNILKYVISDSLNPNKYSVSNLSNLLPLDTKTINTLYTLIDYVSGNTSNWVASPYTYVNVILNNKNNPLISNKLNNSTISKLTLLNKVMKSTINNSKYNYKNMGNILGIDSSNTKKLYALYTSNYKTVKVSPISFVKFIINHKNDDLLKGKISNEMLSKLNLLDNVMNSVNNNKKHSSKELSIMLGLDKDKLDLLYSLYSYNKKGSVNVSLKAFTNFIENDVMKNKKYSSNFDNNSKNKIKTINRIIYSSDKNIKYTNNELFGILSILSEDLDKSMIEVLYIYYGSEKTYNNDWKLTIEEFIDYLNNDILPDERFKDFIDDEIKDKITSSKDKVRDAKKLIVGKEYSRVVIKTDLKPEGDTTFKFINDEKKTVKSIADVYFIGNSPMALDMSESFGKELDFITILTMIAIFIAVAFTFKSAIIPTILVLIIQCAVFLTMGILSVTGGVVYFIALLIVQSILMGATIDYAIVYTSYYIESRNTMSVKDSIINAYQKSIHTILTSSSILIIVTFIVGNFANAIAAKICMTLSKGTICSVILILFLLPAILAAIDRIIIKNKVK